MLNLVILYKDHLSEITRSYFLLFKLNADHFSLFTFSVYKWVLMTLMTTVLTGIIPLLTHSEQLPQADTVIRTKHCLKKSTGAYQITIMLS